MSEVTAPTISISDLATTLRAALTGDQQLTLDSSILGDPEASGYLLGLLDVDALMLAAAQVSDIEGGLCVTGRASFLSLADLDVTLTVTAPASGIGLSLRATPSGTPALSFPGFASLSIGQLAVAIDVTRTAGKWSLSGALNGTLRLDNIDVPLSIHLPRTPEGTRITGSFSDSAGLSPLAFAGLVPGMDLLSSLPAGLGELVTLRELEIVVGPAPFLSFTLAAAQPWEIVPDSLSIESAELSVRLCRATDSSPFSSKVRGRALLRAGASSIPIVLAPDAASGDWRLTLDSLEIPLPGLTDLAGLVGGAEQLQAIIQDLGSFGALALTSFQLRVNPARRLISSLSFCAAAQAEWTLPLFGGVSFGRPSLSMSVEGLGLGQGSSPPPDSGGEIDNSLKPIPYFAFRAASAAPWELVPQALSLSRVELFVGVALGTAYIPRSVRTRFEAVLQVGAISLPIVLASDGSTGEWVLGLDSPEMLLPGLTDLAQLFGGAEQLEQMLPGLGSFGELALTSLQLRIAHAPLRISQLSFSAIAENDWTLPPFTDLALRNTKVALSIVNPLSSARAVTGSVNASVVAGGHEFSIAASKDSPSAVWCFAGQQVGTAPLSLTALARDALGSALPDGVPELSFVNLQASLTPSTGEFTLSGSSAAPWTVPLGFADLALSNVQLALHRTVSNGKKSVSLEVRGDLAMGGVTSTLALAIPGGFALSAALPAVKLSDVLKTLGGGAVLQGLGLPASFFDFALGPSRITLDAAAKTASISGSAPGFSALELQLRRDSRGKLGAALALAPQGGANLQSLLGVPGLDGFSLTNMVFVLSSMYDPSLRFSAPAFSAIANVTRGFGFQTTLDVASLGVGNIPGLPTAPLVVKGTFGSTLADLTLAAAMSQPGGRIVLDQASGLCLIDPELRISPAVPDIGVAGRLDVVLKGKTLEFVGGFKLSIGKAELYATLEGDWPNPFGFSGVVARNLSLSLSLPGLPALAGTLQIGRQSGTLAIKPDPVAPVLDVRIANLDLHDLLSSVCDPALASVPAEVRQTITDIRIENAEIYFCPQPTTIGAQQYDAGVMVAGKMHAWGLDIDGQVQMAGSGPLRSLVASGAVTLPELGGFLVLAESFDGNGAPHGSPHFNLNMQPGKLPVVNIAAAASVLGTSSAVNIVLNDAGFKFSLSGPLLGGAVRAQLAISGGRLGPQARYAVAAEIDTLSLSDVLKNAGNQINNAISLASAEIDRAQKLFDLVNKQGRVLQQQEEQQRQAIQAQRNADAAKLRKAQSDLQAQKSKVDALARSLDAARATVAAERADVDRRLAAAQRDVNAAANAVNSLTGEINSTDRWFHSLPRADWPWKPSQAREGAWYGAKMGALYAARSSAIGVLNVANQALQTLRNAQRTFPIDADPRVAGILVAWNAAIGAMQAIQSSIDAMIAAINLAPIDADFRIVALQTAEQAQAVQIVAAQAALDLAKSMLTGVANLNIGSAVSALGGFVPSIQIKRAYFSGELSIIAGGQVRMGLEVMAAGTLHTFTVSCDLGNPVACATEIVKLLLGMDHAKAIAAVARNTDTATNNVKGLDLQLLADHEVVLKSGSNGNYLKVVRNLLHYGDAVWLKNDSTRFYLVGPSQSELIPQDGFITSARRWILQKPNAPTSTDLIHYGDPIILSQDGQCLVASQNQDNFTSTPSSTLKEHWAVVLASNPSASGVVDLSQGSVALRSDYATYLGANSSASSSHYPPVTNINTGNASWSLGLAWPSAFGYLLSPSGTDPADPNCHFTVVRSGDWFGFRSFMSGQYVQVLPDNCLYASAPSILDASNTTAHFRVEGSNLFNQARGHYLSNAPASSSGAPLQISCTATSTADAIPFEIMGVAPAQVVFYSSSGSGFGGSANSDVSTSLNVAPSQLSAGDAPIAAGRQDELASSAAAGVGPSAEVAAAAQATQLNASADSTVAPAQLALAQSDADRRARRERAIEKAARPPREVMDAWRDGALRFDGQSYLEAPATRAAMSEAGVAASPIIALGTGFTIEAWICPESLASEQSVILGKWRGSSEDELRFFISQDGRLNLSWHTEGAPGFGSPGYSSCQSDEAVKFDAWSHVAAVRDGDAVSLYIDGRRAGGAQGLGASPLRVGACNWRIGAQEGDGPHYFVGLIDSLRIWDHALPQATLRGQRFLVSRGDEAGLLACWNLDEPSGDTAFDAGPLELHALLVGNVHRASPGAQEGPALSDRYLTLAGNAHALVGDIDLFGGGTAMTIEAWVRVERMSEDIVSILNKWAQGIDDEVLFGLGSSSKLIFAWHTQGGTAYSTPGWNHIYSDSTIPLGRWCHVAVVRDGQMIRFYCDGAPIGASASADTLPLRRGAVPLCIGSERGQLRHLEGSLAELRVLQRAVSDQELREHYRRPFVGDEPQLAALWRFDEGAGRRVRDATASGHHGTLVGPVSWPAHGGPPRLVGPTRGMHFSGSQYLEFGDADPFSPSMALTIESWVRLDAITEDFTSIVNKWAQSADDEYLFGLMTDGRLVFAWHTQGDGAWGTPSWNASYSDAKLTLNRFTHVAVVRAGQTVSFFMDGQPAGSADVADSNPFRNGTATLRIGAEAKASGRYLQGTLAGLRIWRTARTVTELAASMSGLCTSRAPGRILDLRFDEGEGTTVVDASSGAMGSSVGQPSFVPITLPVRQPVVSAADPTDAWVQPALVAAQHCQTTGADAAAAMAEVDAALAQLGRSTHPQVTSLLAKAGYAPQEVAAAIVKVWAQGAAEVARQYYQAGRSVAEALVGTDAALALGAGSSHLSALTLASAAGYAPELLGAALSDVWGHDARAVAKMYLDGALPGADAASAVWAALGRHSLPCFSALVEVMLAAGHQPGAVGQALKDSFGCDASTIARAVQRSGGSTDVATAAAGEADVLPQAPPLTPYYLFDTKHRLCVVAGDVYDEHVYHQAPQSRPNAVWTLESVEAGGFLIRDQKHGKCLVAGDVYDGHVYHQDPGERQNAVWDKSYAADGSYFLGDQKHGKALVAGDVADNNVYHQDPAGRLNARWMLIPVAKWAELKEVRQEISNFTPVYNLAIRTAVDAAIAGWMQQSVAFVAYATPQPGTIPIYRETPPASPDSQFHFSSRSPSETVNPGWSPTGVAFFAFATQVPGTIPVYREELNGHYFFTVRPASVSAACGYQRDNIAFYAYPPDALNPRPRVALKTSSGQFVHLDGNGVTGTHLVAKRSSLGGAEPFQIIELGQDRVALQATSGKYVMPAPNSDTNLFANQDAIGSGAFFTRHAQATGTILLQASDGSYVTAGADQTIRSINNGDPGQQAFTVVPLPAADAIPAALVEVQEEVSIYGANLYKYSTESQDAARAAGWTQQGVAFVAYSASQPGTVPIYKETLVSSPGSQFHFWHRTDQEARSFGWMQTEIAFHAFAWQAPGTVPVYREYVAGSSYYHFSTHSAAEAAQAGFQQADTAFFAYPPDALKPNLS